MKVLVLEQPATYWEKVAVTYFGRYLTQLESELVSRGMTLAGEGGSALEIGCEGGRWSQLLSSRGWTLTCTDTDPKSLELCRQRIPSARCILVNASAKMLPCASASQQLVLCIEVPIVQAKWFAREAARVLKPGGVLICTCHNKLSLRAFVHKGLRHSGPEARFYERNYVAVRQGMIAAGFSLVEQCGCCWIPFSRSSNSCWVPFFGGLEERLRLRRLPSLSPWVLMLARKTSAGKIGEIVKRSTGPRPDAA